MLKLDFTFHTKSFARSQYFLLKKLGKLEPYPKVSKPNQKPIRKHLKSTQPELNLQRKKVASIRSYPTAVRVIGINFLSLPVRV